MIQRAFNLSIASISLVAAVPAQAAAPEAPSITTAAPNAEKLGVARQIIDQGFPVAMREPMFMATMDQMVAQTREATLRAYGLTDEGAVAILDQWSDEYVDSSKVLLRRHIPKLMEAMAASYAAIFTLEELKDILAFASTPSGQRFFQLSPALLAEPNFAAANQVYINDVQAQMPSAIQELVRRLERYKNDREAGPNAGES